MGCNEMMYACLKNVYKFHTWDAKDCYDNGIDRYVIADSESEAHRKMEKFVEYMRRNGVELKFSELPRLYIEDAIY